VPESTNEQRTTDERQSIGFKVMDGNNKTGRPHREWVDDAVDFCRDRLQNCS